MRSHASSEPAATVLSTQPEDRGRTSGVPLTPARRDGRSHDGILTWHRRESHRRLTGPVGWTWLEAVSLMAYLPPGQPLLAPVRRTRRCGDPRPLPRVPALRTVGFRRRW